MNYAIPFALGLVLLVGWLILMLCCAMLLALYLDNCFVKKTPEKSATGSKEQMRLPFA